MPEGSPRANPPIVGEGTGREMPALQVRPYRSEDLDLCIDLFLRVFEGEPWNDRWPTRSRARAYLSDIVHTPGFRGFVAVAGPQLVGLCIGHRIRWWQGDEYSLDEFCIDVPFQGMGVGTWFLERVEAHIFEEGMGSIVLLTRAGTPAAAFYEKQGFAWHAGLRFYHKALSQPADQG
jgi:ribosomal protein S18 acetylase RimI-like enzyme